MEPDSILSSKTRKHNRSDSALTSAVHRNIKDNKCAGIRKFDVYGTPVQLHYNGANSYTTLFGATISFVTYVILLGVTVWSIIRFTQRINPQFSEYTEHISFESDKGFDPFCYGFDFAFALSNKGKPIEIDK